MLPGVSSSAVSTGFARPEERFGSGIDYHGRMVDLSDRELERYVIDAILETSLIGWALVRADGTNLKTSKRMKELLGLGPGPAPNMADALDLLFRGETRAKAQAAWAAGPDDPPSPISLPVDCADGRRAWLRFQLLKQGENILVIAQDVTAHEEAVEAVAKYAESLEAILTHSFDGIAVVRDDGTIQGINPGMERILGFGEEDVQTIGEALGRMFPNQIDLAAIEAMWAEDMVSEAPHERVILATRTDGQRRWCRFQISRMRNAVVVNGQDIHEQVSTQAALRASEGRLRGVFESAQIGMIVTGPGARILRANPALCSLLDYTEDELRQRTFVDITHPDDVEHSRRQSQALRSGKAPHIDMEKRYVRRDGSVVWARTTVSRTMGPAEDGREFVVMVQDISQRKRMERELGKIEKLESLGVLAGGIAHDFNNLLTGILGNLSLARMQQGDPVGLSKRLDQAEKASLRARELTQQLLTFSRGGAPVKKTLAAGALVRETAEFAISGSNVLGQVVVAEDLWLVDADPGQLGQVVHNLVINADQAMPDGGAVHVRVANRRLQEAEVAPLSAGRYITISVSDEGQGIAPETLPRIFDPFFSTKAAGTGLGLATAYSIVSRHGGHIAVHTEKTVGTCMTVFLPASEARTAAEPVVEPGGACRGRVLIMDDEEHVRTIAGEILRTAGFMVDCTADGRAAIDTFGQARQSGEPYDVVVLDLTVPGGVGGQVALGELRQLDPGVQALVSSGYSNDPVMAAHREHGFAGVIAKPYTAAELVQAVRRLLPRWASPAERSR